MNKFLEVGGGILIVGFIVCCLVGIFYILDHSATAQVEIDKLNQTQKDKYIQLCIDKGGIPKISGWDGRLTDCIIIK